MNRHLFLMIFSCLIGHSAVAQSLPYQDGDLIFHESKSNQSKAIREATGSRWSHVGILFHERGHWLVAEAVQPIRLTALSSFIARGKNRHYRVYRYPSLSDAQRIQIRSQVGKYIGKNYDIYFEWSDDLIYCSELIYKVFRSALGIEVGVLQKFRELKLDGPYVKELIRRRIQDTGRTLNLDEAIVTPDTQLNDPNLTLIERTDR